MQRSRRTQVRGQSLLSTQTCGAAVLRRTVGRAKALRRCRRMAGHEWAGFWVREERLTGELFSDFTLGRRSNPQIESLAAVLAARRCLYARPKQTHSNFV